MYVKYMTMLSAFSYHVRMRKSMLPFVTFHILATSCPRLLYSYTYIKVPVRLCIDLLHQGTVVCLT